MIEHNEIDNILEDSLKSYSPKADDRHRSRFLEEASTFAVPQTNRNFRRNKYIVGGLLLLVFMTGMVFVFITNTEEIPSTSALVNRQMHEAENLKPENQQHEVINQVQSPTIINKPEEKQRSSNTENSMAEIRVRSNKIDNQTNLIVEEKPGTETVETPILTDNSILVEAQNEFENQVINEVDVKKSVLESESIPTEIQTQSAPGQTEKDIPERKPARNGNHTAMFNIYYRPEMIFNIIENEKLMHGLGTEFQYKMFNNKYVLGTGLGVSISNGYYEYAINYNEFLGTYKKLDSISFDFNEQIFQMTQTVHTSESQVFDTATQTEYARVYRQFVYLQIPFLMGYDFVTKENYSLGIRFSPILSILLTNKPVDFQYDAGQNQIIQINRITPERVQTNWQLIAGFNFTRYSKNRLFFEIEPRVTYYFNSVYQKSDHTNPPYGFGLRLGIGLR
jgi:hypothetical protein